MSQVVLFRGVLSRLQGGGGACPKLASSCCVTLISCKRQRCVATAASKAGLSRRSDTTKFRGSSSGNCQGRSPGHRNCCTVTRLGKEEKSTVSSPATVMSLLDMIMAGEEEGIKQATIELRLLSKWEMNYYRIVIGEAGGIPLVVSALCSSSDPKVQENAVTALLNLSIYPANRATISEVLRAGATSESKENVAALLSSLLIAEELCPLGIPA